METFEKVLNFKNKNESWATSLSLKGYITRLLWRKNAYCCQLNRIKVVNKLNE